MTYRLHEKQTLDSNASYRFKEAPDSFRRRAVCTLWPTPESDLPCSPCLLQKLVVRAELPIAEIRHWPADAPDQHLDLDYRLTDADSCLDEVSVCRRCRYAHVARLLATFPGMTCPHWLETLQAPL